MRILLPLLLLLSLPAVAQLRWHNVDTAFQPLPSSVHVFMSTDSIEGKPNIAYYLVADLKDRRLSFTTDTSMNRRLTPSQFYERDAHPLAVVNCTFFSFETNRSLNLVIKNKKLLAYNINTANVKKPDSSVETVPVYHGAIGIDRKRNADVAWIKTDSGSKYAFASQVPLKNGKPKGNFFSPRTGEIKSVDMPVPDEYVFHLWKMKSAVGGGPVLLQNGEIHISNNEERKFMGKAINDRHPRTAMGYTADNKLVILVVQGRFPGLAEGASLIHLASILKDLGCVEALNLDGGGSSCLLVNGKQTITPSEKGIQRAVPAVFIIQ
ncbi:MAG TPA: phosphodiester glycosidase family protein [Chitinophagaceae bacterium]